jgi:hypothetical protein
VQSNADGCGNSLDLSGCPCDAAAGTTRLCYTGPAGSSNLGTCHAGQQTCNPIGEVGGVWGPCAGDVVPTTEDCADGKDTNCNGLVGCDEIACAGQVACCTAGTDRACYTGPAGTDNVGICHDGINTCDPSGAWDSVCSGEVTPGKESGNCHDGLDNDCNGLVDCADFGCIFDIGCLTGCTAGSTQSCYSGPSGTEGVGQCKGGSQTCNSNGNGFGSCSGEVDPAAEGGHCTDGIDNDCDGKVDCDDSDCTGDPACCTPTAGVDATIYATSADTLYTIDPSTWTETAIGFYNAPGGDKMTDLAMTPNGSVYTLSGTALYQIDTGSGQATKLVSLGGTLNNGLTFLPDNTLLASDAEGTLKHINPSNGSITIIGTYCGQATCGPGYGIGSSGDIVAVADGTTYGVTATDGSGNDLSSDNELIKINTSTGAATVVGPIGFANVFGLAYYGGHVIGFDYLGDVIQIDTTTGAGTRLSTQSGTHFFGGTTSPLIPVMGCP